VPAAEDAHCTERTSGVVATSYEVLCQARFAEDALPYRTAGADWWGPRAFAAIRGEVLETAFDLLEARDLVVGPTHDGGYYLVGAKASHSDLFASDGMGTANALEALLTRARALGLSVHLADPFYDIDVESDLTRLAAELLRSPDRAPRTAAWLKQWGQAVAQLRTSAGNL
jgi:2-phospho-L-lactate guanylyltransferase (CobY/MobA/RfbA family)